MNHILNNPVEFVSKILIKYPPKDKGFFDTPVMFYIFPNTPVYKLFLIDDDFNKLLNITKVEIMLLYEYGMFGQKDVVLFYPELWLTKKQEQQFFSKLQELKNTDCVRVITNSDLMLAGLNRTQIISIG